MNEAPFKCSTQGLSPGLTHKHQTRLAILARDKHTSLLQKSVTDKQKFYNIGPRFVEFNKGGKMFLLAVSQKLLQFNKLVCLNQSNICGYRQGPRTIFATLHFLVKGLFTRPFSGSDFALSSASFENIVIFLVNRQA